jgi:hypothetical protein
LDHVWRKHWGDDLRQCFLSSQIKIFRQTAMFLYKDYSLPNNFKKLIYLFLTPCALMGD